MVPKTDHLLTENVVVLPTFQGHGYERQLMVHAEMIAMSLDLPETRLCTNVIFAQNVQLYRRLGYQMDQEVPFKGGFTASLSKRLRSAG